MAPEGPTSCAGCICAAASPMTAVAASSAAALATAAAEAHARATPAAAATAWAGTWSGLIASALCTTLAHFIPDSLA